MTIYERGRGYPLIVQNFNRCNYQHQQLASSVAVPDFIECTKDIDIIGQTARHPLLSQD